MTEAAVIKVVAKLTTDDTFREEFKQNPHHAIDRAGYRVSDEELQALTQFTDEGFEVSIEHDIFKFRPCSPPAPNDPNCLACKS